MTSRFSNRPATRPPSRRRQRSVRVTVAVVLLGVATLAVVLALPAQSAPWLSVSSVLALSCGFAAARIIYSELAQSRREAAADRASQAHAYRAMFTDRAQEHAEFTTAMTERLIRRDREVRELESSVVLAQKRATEAESRVQREARRANEALEVVAELQVAIEIRKAEEADELAIWDADVPGVLELLTWDEKVGAGHGSNDSSKRKRA